MCALRSFIIQYVYLFDYAGCVTVNAVQWCFVMYNVALQCTFYGSLRLYSIIAFGLAGTMCTS